MYLEKNKINEAIDKALDKIIEIADPDKVILFGSLARGDENSDSDIDLLILKKQVDHSRKLAQEIRRNLPFLGIPVDLIVYESDKYEKIKDYPFKIYYTINREGSVIYEKGS